MKNNTLIPFFTLFFSLFSYHSLWADEVTFANCGDDGCRFTVQETNKIEFAVIANNPDIPYHPDKTLVFNKGTIIGWSDLSSVELDLLYGGKGDKQVIKLKPTEVIDLSNVPSKKPLEVFPDSDVTTVVNDGNWQPSIGVIDKSQCAIIEKQTIPIKFPKQSSRIQWDGVFHPKKLFFKDQGRIKWKKKGENRWLGVVLDDTSSKSATHVSYSANLINPDEITGTFRLVLKVAIPKNIPASVAAMMNCTVTAPIRWQHIQ